MKEHALLLGRDRSLVGILTENGGTHFHGNNSSTAVLLLDAGLIHHIGPNRIYVKMARRLAAMGFVVLRFDFSGIGDSGPRRDKMPATEGMIDEMVQAMDYLERSQGVNRFVCVGLCAGAAAAGQISTVDQRVKKLILINPLLAGSPGTNLMIHSRYYLKHALFNPRSWLKFITMRSSYRDVWRAVRLWIERKIRPNSFPQREDPGVITRVREFFLTLRSRGVEVLIVYSGGEIGDEYFRKVIGGEYRLMQDSGLLTIRNMDGADHLVTPLACQEELLTMISKWVSKKGMSLIEALP